MLFIEATQNELEGLRNLFVSYSSLEDEELIGIGHALDDVKSRAAEGDWNAEDILKKIGYPKERLDALTNPDNSEDSGGFFFFPLPICYSCR